MYNYKYCTGTEMTNLPLYTSVLWHLHNELDTSHLIGHVVIHSCIFRKEREAAAKSGTAFKNKMFLEQDDELLVHAVNHSVRQLCKTMDAFIYVVDSSTSKEKGNCTSLFS